VSVAGSWRLVVDAPIGKQHLTVRLDDSGGALSGTVTNENNGLVADIFEGSVEGEELRWKMTLSQVRLTLTFTVSVAGDEMAGKVKAGLFGRFAVRGGRAPEAVEANPAS
jgi:hypothetical protein